MRIKGLERERKYRKRRYGMRLDGASVRRVQLALLNKHVILSEAKDLDAPPKATRQGPSLALRMT